MTPLRILSIASLALVILGCDQGVKRHRISGTVTFGGAPVPYGHIFFEPDTERGGRGPAGFATIRDGEFNTKKSGKGSVSGPMKVRIEGFKSDQPYAANIFKTYRTTADITARATLDFEVPAEFKVESAKESRPEDLN